jgi:hypothetical protein
MHIDMKLDMQCAMCRSWSWCGRQCKNAPDANDRWLSKDFTPVAGDERPEYIVVGEFVINSIENVINKSAARQAKWRKANPELNRERAKVGMRQRRSMVL